MFFLTYGSDGYGSERLKFDGREDGNSWLFIIM